MNSEETVVKYNPVDNLRPYQFKPGESGNPDGRKPMTEQEKLIKKASKEIIKEYKEALAEALPMIQPVLIAKALEGDMTAIKEVHDRAMDKAKQATDITTNGESIQPLLVKFIDGNKTN